MVLRVLSEVGIELGSDWARKAFAKKGAKVGSDHRVKFPNELVEELIGLAPSIVNLTGLNNKELRIGSGEKYNNSICIDPKMVDYDDGLRGPVLNDVVKHATIGDYLPAVHTIYKMDMDCSDIERNAQELKSIEACFANTTKHIYCIPANMRSARIWTEMANIRADGKSLGEYPILSFSSYFLYLSQTSIILG